MFGTTFRSDSSSCSPQRRSPSPRSPRSPPARARRRCEGTSGGFATQLRSSRASVEPPPAYDRRRDETAVLGALASGNAMTTGEVAAATGLGRATISTTLSKLAKTGEVTKAPARLQPA